MLDSVIRENGKYYPQTLLEECKHEIKMTKMENLINDDFDTSSSDNKTDSHSDNDTNNKPGNDESNEKVVES